MWQVMGGSVGWVRGSIDCARAHSHPGLSPASSSIQSSKCAVRHAPFTTRTHLTPQRPTSSHNGLPSLPPADSPDDHDAAAAAAAAARALPWTDALLAEMPVSGCVWHIQGKHVAGRVCASYHGLQNTDCSATRAGVAVRSNQCALDQTIDQSINRIKDRYHQPIDHRRPMRGGIDASIQCTWQRGAQRRPGALGPAGFGCGDAGEGGDGCALGV